MIIENLDSYQQQIEDIERVLRVSPSSEAQAEALEDLGTLHAWIVDDQEFIAEFTGSK